MPLLALIVTCPLILFAKNKKSDKEEYHFEKLLGIWLLCQLYITINHDFRLPIGFICAILIVYNDKYNKKSKFMALIFGFTSLLLSSLVYLLFKH